MAYRLRAGVALTEDSFHFQHLQCGSQPSGTQVPEKDLMPFCDFFEHYTHIMHRPLFRKNTHKHKIKINCRWTCCARKCSWALKEHQGAIFNVIVLGFVPLLKAWAWALLQPNPDTAGQEGKGGWISPGPSAWKVLTGNSSKWGAEGGGVQSGKHLIEWL